MHPRISLAAPLAAALLAVASQGAAAATVTLSPLPGTAAALPATQISFLGARPAELRSVSVIGSSSGRHAGRLRAYASAPGASFLPAKPFLPGEKVSVRALYAPAKGGRRTLSTSFTVAQPMPVTHQQFPSTPGTPADEQNFISQPALHPPVTTINQAAGGLAPGYVFAAPFMGPAQWGPMIFDNKGQLVWFHPVPAGQDAADFKVQSYRRRPVLTWWQGQTIILGYGLGEDIVADNHYRAVAVVKAGNGLSTDEHEFTLSPSGAAWITAYSPVKADLSAAGGPSDGLAVDCAVQEIDVKTGLVMWEWHALGNVDVSESYSKPPVAPTGAYDYFHLNSVELLPEGNLLISARNTWALYKVDVHSGQIVWRLGGKRTSFALGAGVQFAYQHDARMLPDGTISVFDDEGFPTIAPARGELVKLDLAAKTATLAQTFTHTPPLLTGSQGNVQLLGGGNRMIGWGGLPDFTEFGPHGETLYDGQFPKGEMSYRVYRYKWAGRPLTAPSVAAKLQPSGETRVCVRAPCPPPAPELVVYASWNGATAVATWRVLAGSSPKHLKALTRMPSSGFETNVSIPAARYVRVQALSSSGKVLGVSKTVKGG